MATRWDEQNVKAQCYSCNVMKHWNYIVYTRKMEKELWEDKFLELEQKARSIKHWKIDELEELIEFYKNEVKKLKETKWIS